MLFSQLAWGHAQLLIKADLDSMGIDGPIPRVDNDNLKSDADTCGGTIANAGNVKGEPLKAYVKGSTITVGFKETINHVGVFRFDFSSDNDATFQPLVVNNDPTLNGMINDPNDAGVSQATPLTRTVQVTLPDIVCDNCTFRMTQSMGDLASNNYYSCADVKLVASASDLPAPGDSISDDAGNDGGGTPGADENTTTGSNEESTTGTGQLASFDNGFFGCGLVAASEGGGPPGPPPAAPFVLFLFLLLPLGLLRLCRQ